MDRNLAMDLGIFLKTYKHSNLDKALKLAKQDGAEFINFNISFIKDLDIYTQNSSRILESVASKAENNYLRICSLSATYNLIHPNKDQRMLNVQAVINSIKVASTIGAEIISLCTGTRDKDNQWRFHPKNSSQSAWEDLIHSMELIIPTAEQHKIQLGIEPEINNVINSAQKANKLLEEIQSPSIGIIMDAANLIDEHDLDNQHEVFKSAFKHFGDKIILAHAKDIRDIAPIEYCAAGKGILDFYYYISQLKLNKYCGPIILHGLESHEVKDSMRFIMDIINN